MIITLVTALISNIDEFNNYEQLNREEIVKSYDYEGYREKNREKIELQEKIVEAERLEKFAMKNNKRRKLDECKDS